jgi:hypothetical protein
MQFSLGYFLFDLSFCLHYRDESMLMLVHHLSSLMGLVYGLSSGVSGAELVAVVAGGELTNLSLQTRWFLLATKQFRGNTLAIANDILFSITFFLARVLIGSIHMAKVALSPRVHWCVKFGGFMLYGISLLWFWKVAERWLSKKSAVASQKAA